MPLKQLPNRVWRTYQGGALIDKWKGDTPAVDGSFPEEWIMSTITARGNNRPEGEGLSMINTPMGIVSLNDLIASDPIHFLGEGTATKYNGTGLLIKMLDSRERLTMQVHPDKEFAKKWLNSSFGKTESWYILDNREIDGEKSFIYMGFKKGVTQQLWKQLFIEQDIVGMLGCLHKMEVTPGDAFMIYGGVPHAIGAGCFMMEVQEPTDFTMRVEKTTPAGMEIDDALIHQGVGVEKMLECFHYNPCTYEEALDRWKITPRVIDSTESYTFRTIINANHTDCFAVNTLDLNGEYLLKGGDSFFVVVVYKGCGKIICENAEFDFNKGDEIFLSAAINHVKFKSKDRSKILLCYPPS